MRDLIAYLAPANLDPPELAQTIGPRTAIMVPIAWAVVRMLAIERPGRGAALIVLTAFEMAVLPGVALLSGALWGPYIAGIFASSGFSLSWLEYARVMVIPLVVWCGLVVCANFLVARPGPLKIPEVGLVDGAVQPISTAEKTTAVSRWGWRLRRCV